MDISSFSSFFTSGWGLVMGIAFAIAMVIWHASGLSSKIDDHERRILAVEASTDQMLTMITEIKVSISRIEAYLTTLLQLKNIGKE